MSSALAVPLTVTTAPTHHPEPPAFRIVPVPRSEPPTDDELAAAGLDAPSPSAFQLPLDLPHRPRRQAALGPRARGAGAGTRRRDNSQGDSALAIAGDAHRAAMIGPGQVTRFDPTLISPTRIAIRHFLATCVEIIGGFRPTSQLRPFCLPERFDDIAGRLMGRVIGVPSRSRGTASAPGARPPLVGRPSGGPPRVGRAHQTGPGDRVAIRRVQVCEAVDGVAEVAVVLARRDKVWALALRLESHRGRWLCTHLEVI